MVDDWAKKYVEEQRRKREARQREERDAQVRRDHAEAGASGKFHQIKEQVMRDVQTLREDPDLQSLEFDGSLGREFTVTSRGDLGGEMKVSLNGLLIGCEYELSPDEDPQESRVRRTPKFVSKTLRICSDLDGNVTIAENGGGKTFADDAEISLFLLRALLDHITSQ